MCLFWYYIPQIIKCENMSKFQNLHSHTPASDGKRTHIEWLDIAATMNVGVMAFTDHDSLPDAEVVTQLQKHRDHQTKWIMGIEISSGLPHEMGGGVSSRFHIAGLFVDPTNQALREHCSKAQAARIERMTAIVENLRGLGFDITKDDCLEASGGESVGRPHIVAALRSKPTNLEIIEQLRQKMQQAAEHDEELKKKYDIMMEQGERQYPYELFLTGQSFISDVYVDYKYWADFDTSVQLIRDAGGVAFIAHYHTIKDKVDYKFLEKLLTEDRIDGVETIYMLGLIGTELESEWEEERAKIYELLKRYDKPYSGGNDAHDIDNLQALVDSDYAQETVGMAEQIVEKTGVAKDWSSLTEQQ